MLLSKYEHSKYHRFNRIKIFGQKVEGATSYDSSLLVAVPRFENRNRYDIKQEDLPFSVGMFGTLMNFLQ